MGTIVILNPDSSSDIGNNHMLWEPAVANFPSLLVSGSFTLKHEGGDNLMDEDSLGNLNPTGTPFPYVSGSLTVDEDSTDLWPSELRGLFYATGSITISGAAPKIDGVVISGDDLLVLEDAEFNYSSTFLDDPPPGFESGELSVVSGSQTRAEAP